MKASILFICYKQEQFVADAIRSAMAQDYHDLELVVCDDGSPDRTLEILEEELEHCPAHISLVRAHSGGNVGLIANFNRGMAACTGDVILVMAGDDVSLPHRVSRVVREFADRPRCMLVFSNWRRIDAEGRALPGSAKHQENQVFSYDGLTKNVYAGAAVYGAAAAYRADVERTFGPMMIGHHPEDRCYWVRALILGEVRYLSQPLMHWRTHEANISNFLRGADSREARKKVSRQMLFRQHYSVQHIRDIRVALDRSLIEPGLAGRLLEMIDIDRESQRLRRYSLTAAPWRLWFGSARRMLALDSSCKSIRRVLLSDCGVRLSARRRDVKWSRKFAGN